MITEILEKLGLKKKKPTDKYSVDENYHEVLEYEFMPTFDKETDDYMIRFSTAKNTDYLLGKLLMTIDRLGFESGGAIEMIDEIWIICKSTNGKITITRDIWDFVFIMARNNNTDLEKIEAELNNSVDFQKIKIEK
ncbi:hypothetical protein [Mangrovimonas sp. TPBH4]|uniref:hypothetical protein n=1 Tax=Mangrovimonas sp. TPBH4 TaxID=1645914 RepID=UPI0006B686B2|nr:hypothetical protein [Mangrovimonas sp. TPBH4]